MVAQERTDIDPLEQGVDHIENITAFADATLEESDPVFAGFKVTPNNTFRPVDISDVLTRNYQIESGTWTEASAGGTQLELFNPFVLLATQSQVSDKLSWFRFVRAKVRVQLRINSSQFNYGKLIAGFIPCATQARASSAFTLGIHQCRPITTSANANETVEFEIPWTMPLDWLDMENAPPSIWAAEFGWVCVQVLLPLRSSSQATASCNYAIFAQFEDIELAGYLGIPIAQGKKRTPQDEASDKAKSGSTQGVLRAATGLASQVVSLAGLSEAVPIIEGIAPVLEALGPVVSLLGFAKPTSVETVRRVMPVGLDMCPMTGIDPGFRICADPEQSLASDVCPESNWDMLSVARVPSIIGSFSYSSTTSVGTRITKFPVNTIFASTGYTPAYHDVIRSMFQYWRGGIKVKLELACSTFFSSRIRIVYAANDNLSGIPLFDQGNVISQIVDVRGDTNVTFTVPYLAATRWLRYNENPGFIEIYLINELVAPDPALTNTVSGIIWAAAADDFQCQLIYNRCTPTALPEAKLKKQIVSQGAIVDDFSAPFEGIAGPTGGVIDKSTCDSEQIYSWEAWVKRYVLDATATGSYGIQFEPVALSSLCIPFLLFNFARGSPRVVVVPDANLQPLFVNRGVIGHGGYIPRFCTTTGSSAGMAYTQFECPWFSKWPYASQLTASFNPQLESFYTTIYSDSKLYRSYGEDIEFGWLLPTYRFTLPVS